MSVEDRIKEQISSQDVFLYMKGEPHAPQCGFSAQVCGILAEQGVKFGSFNILTDEEVRQGIKDYSDWPTLPQLYVKGEFVGGCDIVTELHQNGELAKILEGVEQNS